MAQTFFTTFLQSSSDFDPTLRHNSNWLLIAGAVLTILGLVAIIAAPLTTFLSVLFVGAALTTSGIIKVIHAGKFWWRKWLGFFLHIFSGVLYAIVGAMLLIKPVIGALYLTLLLTLFYLIIGVFRIITAWQQRHHYSGWNWTLLNGIINLALGIIVLSQWPAISLWFIGLIIGIDILFVGIALFMLGLNVTSKKAATV